MDRRPMGRREILRAGGIAAGGVALTTAVGSSPVGAEDRVDDLDESADRMRGNRLRGSWLVEATNGTDTTRSVVSFAGGGVAIVHDIKPAGPPFTGSWRRTGGHGFRATVLSGVGNPETGEPGPTFRIVIDGTVHHDMIEGSFTFTVFGPDDAVLDEFTGSFSGSRIRA